jgi:very-short-patch-repair endonuclease
MTNYNELNEQQKRDIILQSYVKDQKSFGTIAKQYDTYANRIIRDAKKFNIPVRNKSQAQKNALSSGKHKHPTKGRKRSEAEKMNIGSGVMKNWSNADPNRLSQKKENAKILWDKRTDEEKNSMLSKANLAVRQSSKLGSKMEHYVLNFLIENNYKVDFHKEQMLANTRLQIDLFLPEMNIAIEVDGPSHFAPVWGEEVLSRNIAYDQKKSGLIVGKGYRLVRIKQKKDFSKSRASMVCDRLKSVLDNINQTSSKIIEIEDNNA